jgi:hypothetical protein
VPCRATVLFAMRAACRAVLTTMQDSHPRGGAIGVGPPRDEAVDGTRAVHDPSRDGMGLGRRCVLRGERRLAPERRRVWEYDDFDPGTLADGV